MCGICGCSENKEQKEVMHQHHHTHDEQLIDVEERILAKNQNYALANRQFLTEKKSLALNLMSSPGAGKTTLLARTIKDLNDVLDIAVVVGDQQTSFDAELIQSSGGHALQINTGKVCHLDAHSVGHALQDLGVKERSLVFIENIGNLVCPALFDLGEHFRVVILSVTEGDNKPLKYPDMFRFADLLLITKMDLLPYVAFDLEQCMDYARRINPDVEILTLSTVSNEGLQEWYDWLKKRMSMQ